MLFRHAPTDISLSTATIAENMPAGTLVGTLVAVDPDTIETHTYQLIDDPNGDDNELFTVAGNRLLTAAGFNFEQRAAYRVSLQATDSDGLSIHQVKTIAVTDVNEPPHAADDAIDPSTTVFVGKGGPVDVLANDTDPDRDTRCTVELTDSPQIGDASTDGAMIVYDPPDDSSGTVSFPYRITDNGSPPLTDEALVTLTFVADDSRGDCNADGEVDAADLSAVVLELFDEPVNAPWYQIYAAGYPGSPQGCDANGDRQVEVGDLACTALLNFAHPCTGTSVAGEQADPTIDLQVATESDGYTVDVGLLDPSGSTTALVFSVAYNATQAELDLTDANDDGVPDAISWSLPPQAQAWTFVDSGILQTAVVMAATPPTPLPTGTLLSIQFNRKGDDDPNFHFQQISAGSIEGVSLPLQVTTEPLSSFDHQWLPVAGKQPSSIP